MKRQTTSIRVLLHWEINKAKVFTVLIIEHIQGLLHREKFTSMEECKIQKIRLNLKLKKTEQQFKCTGGNFIECL